MQLKNIVSVLIGLLLFSSCSKTIDGEIFITTQGRENIKLGGVNVYILNSKEFNELIKSEIENYLSDLEYHKLKVELAQNMYLESLNKEDSLYKVFLNEVRMKKTPFRVKDGSSYLLDRTVTAKDLKDDLSSWEKRTYEFRRNQFNKFRASNRDFYSRYGLSKFADADDAMEEIVTVEKILMENLEEEVKMEIGTFFLTDPQPPGTIYQTDSEGRFSFQKKAFTKQFLVARAERMIFGEKKEHYFWIIDLETHDSGNKLILSNDKLLDINKIVSSYSE